MEDDPDTLYGLMKLWNERRNKVVNGVLAGKTFREIAVETGSNNTEMSEVTKLADRMVRIVIESICKNYMSGLRGGNLKKKQSVEFALAWFLARFK